MQLLAPLLRAQRSNPVYRCGGILDCFAALAMTMLEKVCATLRSRAPDAAQRSLAVRCRAGAHVSRIRRVAPGSRLCAATLARCSTSGDASTTAPRLRTIHLLRRHRRPCARCELPSPGHDHHRRRGHEQHPGADEPAEIAECEEEGALAAVEVAAGGFEQARGADDVGLGLRRVAPVSRRHAAEQDRDIVEQAIGPGEFEEGVDADQHEADAFQLPHCGRGAEVDRQLARGS